MFIFGRKDIFGCNVLMNIFFPALTVYLKPSCEKPLRYTIGKNSAWEWTQREPLGRFYL